jgi:hypothetical protein
VNLGVDATLGWRLAMVLPGLALILMGLAYYRLTQDTPAGNFADLRASGQFPPVRNYLADLDVTSCYRKRTGTLASPLLPTL